MVRKNLINSKKGDGSLHVEILPTIVFIVILAVAFWFLFTKATTLSTDFEQISPEFNYEYPFIVVQSFLDYQVNSDFKTHLTQSEQEEVVYVKDLLRINSESSKKVLNMARLEYLDKFVFVGEGTKAYENFLKFADIDRKLEKENFLILEVQDNIPHLGDKTTWQKLNSFIGNEDERAWVNGFYYVKTNDGRFAVIHFIGNEKWSLYKPNDYQDPDDSVSDTKTDSRVAA